MGKVMIWILIIISFQVRSEHVVEIERFNTQKGCLQAKQQIQDLLPKGFVSSDPRVIECREIKDE